jgi:hypothetical protein
MAGVLGAPTTSTLFDGKANDQARSGLRLSSGYWFDAERSFGVEAGAMVLESQSKLFSGSSDGTTILARPFTDANTTAPSSVLVAFPGSSSGSVDVRASSGNFYEAHVDFSERIFDHGWVRFNGLFGYRFFRYDEGLHVRQTVNPTDPNFAAGTQIATVDDFNTQNEFHGGEIGLRAEFFWDSLSLDLLGKVAVGNLNRHVNINGNQVVSVPGAAPITQAGGVLALSSNSGFHGSDDWTYLPVFGVNLHWQVSQNLRLRVGYSILFLNEIARAADQIDFTVNPNLFPPAQNPTGPGRPVFTLHRQDFSVQSFSTGLEFTF